MTNRQLLVINILASFLPWVLPPFLSLFLLLIIGLPSTYIWYKNRLIDTTLAYITLGVMTVVTIIHFFFFDQMISTGYAFVIFNCFIMLLLLQRKENISIPLKTPSVLIQQSPSGTNLSEDENELSRKLIQRMDVYMNQVLQTLERQIGKTIQDANQSSSLNIEEIKTAMHSQSTTLETYLNVLKEKIDTSTDMIENQSKEVEGLMMDLQMSMSLHQGKEENLREVLHLLREGSSEGFQIELIQKIIQELQMKGMKMTNSRYVENQQMKDLFYRALHEAKSEICIVSPWLSWWLINNNEFVKLVEAALKKGVNIKIVYGIGSDSSYKNKDDRGMTSEKVVEQLKKKWLKKGYSGKIKFKKSNTHFKLLMCDELFLVIGSYNFLSNQGKFEEEGTWHEAGEYAEDHERIRQLKQMHFSFE
ncbi:phospholipase D-like domain-containing protein [Exiguobacterium artemiae]|uniref:phospholipase D-like domain-containing protein n=1 Tax=Exiguobacterium artemiae TaxID=340145 RepID=UPI00296536CE|nr:phospholipase D-like domain-containing protein [Exiguobacterium sibiricum]MDW2886322.1 phospholipase D-like domain-containing protein [Exiguobacterium sibiricum]